MSEMLQTIVMGAAEQWEQAQEVRGELVEITTLEKDVVDALMGQAAELMLAGADENDGDHRDRHVPPERPVRRFTIEIEADSGPDNECEVEVGASEVIPV